MSLRSLWPALAWLAACNDVAGTDDPADDNHGLTTAVVLTFTPDAGGAPLAFTWSDPEGDGDPAIDAVVLPDGGDGAEHVARGYTLDLSIRNDLVDPPEDVTVEIEEQSDVHQLFFTGAGVEGPATGAPAGAVVTHAYADEDAAGLPVGLHNTLTTRALGAGELTVTLRHLPPEGGAAVKVAGLAEAVAADGFGAIGGDNDVQVTFPLTVE